MNIKEKILNAEVDKKYNLSIEESSSFSAFSIDKSNDYYDKEKIYYSWTLIYRNSFAIGYCFPMLTSHKIKTFKTEIGAKRNLLKKFNKE
jgi:hypothetical protein